VSNLSLVHEVAQTVTAEEEPVTGREGARLEDIDGDAEFTAQGAGDDVAPRVVGRLLIGQDAGSALFLDQRMVRGQLVSPPFADQVGPAVAHVGYEHLAAAHYSGGDRGAHAILVRAADALVVDAPVGLLDGDPEAGTDVTVAVTVVGFLGHLRGDAAGDLASLVPTDAVGDDIEEPFGSDQVRGEILRRATPGVFVVLTLNTSVGETSSVSERCSHRIPPACVFMIVPEFIDMPAGRTAADFYGASRSRG
jgi:hypothetical protein